MLSVALALCLAQAPLAPDTALPPNHPAVPPANTPANHPPVAPGQAAPTAEELLKRLESAGDLKGKEKTFEIASSLGKLYFAHGRYADAVVFLDQAVVKAEPARALYLAKKKAAGSKGVPTPSAAGCVPGAEETMESQLAKAKAQKDPGFAAACARAALHPLIDVETQLGAAKFLTHDAAGAIAVYDRALVLFDSNPEARYGRGAALLDSKGEDVAALKQA
jgi:tetratricopeptide (TPR) repeat protein